MAACDRGKTVDRAGDIRPSLAALEQRNQTGEPMPRSLGPLQLKLLYALRRHGREASLERLVAFAAGLVPNLDARPPYGSPRRSTYVSVARAVATLRRRGLVETKAAGTRKGRIEWQRTPAGAARPVWRFRHPGWRLVVRPVVDSLPPET